MRGSDQVDEFDAGCMDAPLRPGVLQDYFRDVAGTTVPGVANKMAPLRASAAANLLIRDEGDVPNEASFSIRLSCGECHPGLCASRDGDIYNEALTLATSMEKCLGDHLLHKYLIFKTCPSA
eukprot:6544310-Karenia_brevis.AAC.1